LAVVTVLAFGIIYGSKILVKDEANNQKDVGQNDENLPGSIDVSGAEGIVSAREITDDAGNITAYSVVAEATGFATKPVTMEVVFENDAKTIKELKVVSHAETPGYGQKMEEESFLNQFKGISAPIYLRGKAPVADTSNQDVTAPTQEGYQDGIYRVEADEVDNKGYLYMLTIKVEEGKITSLVFDSMNREGEYKSYLSTVGEYVMTDDGPTWKEQADALANYVLEKQSIDGLTVDENGKTDVVSGVSISINNFLDLAKKALQMAKTGEGAESTGSDEAGYVDGDSGEVGEIDGISGATVTSNAIIKLVNNAYDFISDYAK
jgi:major membrane immunogen (membrane-anchored lipoprotein)